MQAGVLKCKVVRPLSGYSDLRFPDPAGTSSVETPVPHYESYYPNRHFNCVVMAVSHQSLLLLRNTLMLKLFCDLYALNFEPE